MTTRRAVRLRPRRSLRQVTDRAAHEIRLSSRASNQRITPEYAVARSNAPAPAERLWGERIEEYQQLDLRPGPYQAACHLESHEPSE